MQETTPAAASLFEKNTPILLVEDDKFFADLLSKKLESCGAKVTHVGSGEDALKELASAIPALVILDILLPGIDGFEVLRRIKADSKFNGLKVVFLSNFASQSQLEEGKKLGITQYFIKAATTPNEIVHTLAALIKKR